jgi:hypothetical protein
MAFTIESEVPLTGNYDDSEPTATSTMSAFQKRMLERQRALEEKKRANANKPEKTKEELLAIRKEMLRKKPVTEKKEEPVPVPEHPKAALMSRLAHGVKVDVDKKDMLKLTNKNYENLPEVKKKREEERKREEAKKR